ncbi:MAG: S8 family serine peptidase, partial [Miltoncostaeaceae bacterium]
MGRPRPRRRPPVIGRLRGALTGLGALLALLPTVAHGADEARLIVTFEPGTRAAQGADALRRAGASPGAVLPGIGARVVSVPADDAGSALRTLRVHPAVSGAERDATVRRHDFVPGDPLWSYQWGTRLIGAPVAWAAVGVGDPSTVIAVVDTGVDATAPDLAGALVAGYDSIAASPGGDDDPNGHGTSSAGVSASRAGDGHGVAGICASCRVMPIRALGADGSGFVSDIAL